MYENNRNGVNFLDILKEVNNDKDILIITDEVNYIISYLKNSEKYLLVTNFKIDGTEIIEQLETMTIILNPKDCINFFKETFLEDSSMNDYENNYHKMTKNIIDKSLSEIGVISFYGNNNISHYFRDDEEIFIFDKKSMNKTSNIKEKTFKDNVQKENIYQRIYLLLKESNAAEELIEEIKVEENNSESIVDEIKEIDNTKELEIEEIKVEENNNSESIIEKITKIENIKETSMDEFSRENAIIKLMNNELISNKNFLNKFLSYDCEKGIINICEIFEKEFDFEFKCSNLDQNSIWKEISKFSDGWYIFIKPIMKFQYLYEKNNRFETTDFYENIEKLKLEEMFRDEKNESFEVIVKSKKII